MLCKNCNVRKVEEPNGKPHRHGLCRLCRQAELSSAGVPGKIVKRRPKPEAAKRFPDCKFYFQCLTTAAKTENPLNCLGCRNYWPKTHNPDDMEIAGCWALAIEVFHPGTALSWIHNHRDPVFPDDPDPENPPDDDPNFILALLRRTPRQKKAPEPLTENSF